MATGDLERSLYRGKRPGRIARAFMRWWAFVAGLGITKDRMVTLEVVGRSSGRTRALPVVLIHVGGERYVASMLGDDVAWVRNVRASGGKATIRAGRRESVVLVEIPPTQRAPMLKEFLRVAPGARPHISVDKDAPVEAFEAVAAEYPVFRVTPDAAVRGTA